MNEKLSAFVDNELSELEERSVLTELERNEEMRATWERYHLIRAALRNELNGATAAHVSSAVAAAVAREPVPRRSYSVMSIGRALGGLAIAASVATVAVLSLQSPVAPPGEVATVAKPTSASAILPVSDGNVNVHASNATDDLNAYLLEHSEFAPTAGVGNMLPYVRSVNHDSSQSTK